MEKKIIDEGPEKVEIAEEVKSDPEETLPEDWGVEFTSNPEYIQAATTAMAAVDNIDTALLTKADELRIKRIKRQGLKIISECLNELYNEIFDDSTDSSTD